MSGLKNQDIHKIIQLFENELCMLPKVTRTDKMKLRKKILNTLMPLLNEPGVSPHSIALRIDSKLEDVLSLFLDTNLFRSKLTRLLNEKSV